MAQKRILAFVLVTALFITAGAAYVLFPNGKSSTESLAEDSQAHTSTGAHKQASSQKATQSPKASAATNNPSTQPSPLAEIPGKTYPVSNLNAEFASLSDKAAHGDLIAARTLADALQKCANVPKSVDELDKEIADATRPNLDPGWAEFLQSGLGYKRQLFGQCQGTTPTQIATRGKWVGILAEAGDSEARLIYAGTARPTDYLCPLQYSNRPA
jgi:hypothetical protein